MESIPLSLHCIPLSFSASSHKKIKARYSINKKKLHPGITSNVTPFPKSSSTSVLANEIFQVQRKQQALDHILKDLKISIDRGIKIDTEIFSSLLEICYQIQSFEHGIRLRSLIPRKVLRTSAYLSAKLLRLYASLGKVEEAQQLFDEMPQRDKSTFAWNSLISGYTEQGRYEDALSLYFQMEEEFVQPDRYTFPRVLKACAGHGSILVGEAIHRQVIRCGFGSDIFVLNSLLDMYAKCGDIVKARKLFDNIPLRDSVSWNSMLNGYIIHGLLFEAADIFRRMLLERFEPDSFTLSTIIVGFSSSKIGTQIHGWILRKGIECNLSIENSLIKMYSVRGRLRCARKIFDEIPDKDLFSWNIIVSAYRRDPEILSIFQEMEDSKKSPDAITFVSLLSACANLGILDEGQQLFRKMVEVYNIEPSVEHYACMVNLLGRAGKIVEAYELIVNKIGLEGTASMWGALLYACSVHVNIEIGEKAAEKLFELEPDNAHNFELLMEIYGKAGKWDEIEKVVKWMRDRGLD